MNMLNNVLYVSANCGDFTYHGASMALLCILFWINCILCMCLFDADFHMAQTYCHRSK